MLKKNFWKKKLNQFNKEEWEALCDRCGKCCLIKLEDEDSEDIFYTNISCKLLCVKTANCTNYIEMEKQRKCVRNRVISEKEIDIKKIQNYITDWENN